MGYWNTINICSVVFIIFCALWPYLNLFISLNFAKSFSATNVAFSRSFCRATLRGGGRVFFSCILSVFFFFSHWIRSSNNKRKLADRGKIKEKSLLFFVPLWTNDSVVESFYKRKMIKGEVATSPPGPEPNPLRLSPNLVYLGVFHHSKKHLRILIKCCSL